MRTRFLSPALLLLLPALLQAKDLVPVGVARVDITPKYAVRLNGYGNRRAESAGVALPIWAKALAIGEGDDAVVLLTVDNLGVPEEMSAELAKRLRLPRERVALCSSHTHAAPMLTNVAPTIFGTAIPPEHQQNIDRYTRELMNNLEQVALAALRDRKPALLSWAKGKVTFARNRRTANGPVDHDLPVLRVTDEAGKIRAILVNYACHCTTLGGDFNKIHGDWAGIAQQLLERSYPGAVAMVAIGCGADSNPQPRGTLNLVLQHGESIALEVGRLLRGEWKPLPAKIKPRFDYVNLEFDKLPSRQEWEARAKQGGAVGYHAQVQLRKLAAGQQIPTTLRYPVQTWAFGDRLAMVFLAGEVVVDYALQLKKEYDRERIWINAYANDDPCYIPSVRILKEGGYEGGGAMIYYDRPTRFAPNVEELILNTVRKQVPAEFKAPKDPLEFPPPKSPRDSLSALKVKPGLRAELVAAEPLVQSPVAIDWGPDGKLWVAEMFDYPTGVDLKFTPGGRVKYLEDSNGDGIYDRAVTLADDLPFPTGLMAWKKGVLVCAAPDIVYLEDTNGDGKADVRRVLFTGFSTENYQARVNSLTRGLDGWIYAANGLLGGKIESKIGPPRTVELGGRDLRFKPDTGELEPVSGLSQQGRARDDFGNWFGCENGVLLRHFPLPEQYLRRNPHFTPPSPMVHVPTGDADPNRLFPVSRILRRYNDYHHAGRVTSACSSTIYRDDHLGREYAGNAFICEPVHNVVTRRVLMPRGTTFIGKRAADEQASEFLASLDNWFRPVQVITGPDGGLWVVDMYRFVIDHPRWIQPEQLAEIDVRAGADCGRIYRLVPDRTGPRPVPRFDRLTPHELVNLLTSPNGPTRDLAHWQLLEIKAVGTAPALRQLAATGSPATKVHALSILDLFGQLDSAPLLAALNDPHSKVRRHAVQLAEAHLKTEPMVAAVTKLATDDDAGVRFQVACSLGQARGKDIGRILVRIALRDRGDAYTVAAVLSSLHRDNLAEALAELLVTGEPADSSLFAKVMALAPAMADARGCGELLERIATPSNDVYKPWQIVAAGSLLDALERRGQVDVPTGTNLAGLMRIAREQAQNDQVNEQHRVAAIRLLARFKVDLSNDVKLLGQLTEARQPLSVQSAAVERLAQVEHADTPAVLLSGWNSQSIGLRARVLDALLSRDRWALALLDAIAAGRIKPTELDATRRHALMNHRRAEIRDKAATVLKTTIDPDRRKAVEAYAVVRKLSGDRQRGVAVFTKSCSACHRVGDVGNAIGPDLAGVTDRSVEGLLIAILDPNRALDGRYASFTALTKRGQQFSGMLRSESAAGITLVAPDGKTIDILRSELEELINSGKSLMPEGLEKDITPQAMADLIAFLQSIGRPPKTVAGNQPALVRPGSDGVLRLRASDCEIHGDDITFEAAFQNIGMWHGEQDHVVWSVPPLPVGRYRVEMTYACHNSFANNVMVIQIGSDLLTTRVTGTGQWSDYVDAKVGDIDLSGGAQRVTVRPAGPVRGALMDLKELRLVPVK